MSRVGAPRLRPRRPFVCVGRVVCCVCWACCVLCVLGVLGRFCVRLLGWLGGALVLAWCWLWCGWGLCRDSVPTFLCVLALLGLCGGNCYHRRCVAACRRRVGGLWSQNPPRGCSEGPASRARGGVYGCKTPRVVAQSAVHLGEIWVTWGVWGVVDDGLGVVASPCGVAGSARAVLGVFQWVRPLPMSEVVWWRGSCSACLRLFVVVVWLVFVGGLGELLP